MYSQFLYAATALTCLQQTVFARPQTTEFDTKNFKSFDIIDKDVAIIGGGASGQSIHQAHVSCC
jgi:hypothetical protein